MQKDLERIIELGAKTDNTVPLLGCCLASLYCFPLFLVRMIYYEIASIWS